jgi:hypothetical protein
MKHDPIIEYLNRVRTAPGMYIGRDSVVILRHHLAGYGAAIDDATEWDTKLFESFIASLYEKYGYGPGGDSWETVLSRVAGGDSPAFYLFYQELDAFLAIQS